VPQPVSVAGALRVVGFVRLFVCLFVRLLLVGWLGSLDLCGSLYIRL